MMSRPCDFGSECPYLAQCPECEMCYDHCRCDDGLEDDFDRCHHGVSFDEDCEDCDDENAD
jgi:hypothetical protein